MATRPLDPVNAWEMEEPAPETSISESELIAALQREADAAEDEWSELRDAQDLAYRYYEAKPFGNEVAGRSQIILPDVQETIDYMVVEVLKPFVSGGRVVEFEATDEADEASVDEATDAIGFNFMREQDGYRILYDWAFSGLLEKAGIVKTIVETEHKVVREQATISDPLELQNIEGEIEDVAEEVDGTMTVSLKREITKRRFLDVGVPFNEFRFSSRARHEDEADYLAHVCLKTRSDLVEMGFDADQVYSLPKDTKLPDERHDGNYWRNPESTPALDQILYREEYARIDLDGDGIAERVKVCRVDREILRWADSGEMAVDTVTEQPFSLFCPYPKPYRIIGYSLAEKVMDIQLSRSTVARQLMDGMYNANMPRPVVAMGEANENTISDILSPVPGAPIRAKTAGAVTPYTTTFDVGKSIGVMEWLSAERESRTSITRLNKGIDKDALNDTASGQAQLMAAGAGQQEFIARNLAEPFSRLMAKKYRLMRTEGEPFKIKVDGQYKQVDPSRWPEEVNISIRVGLGTGSKEQRIQARMMLAPILAEGFQAGSVEPKHLYHAVDGLVRDLGIGQGDDYWVDPDAPPEVDPETGQPKQKAEKPDPEMVKVQAEKQREDAKLQLEAAKSDAALQLSREESAAKIELMRAEAAAKLELERDKAASEQNMNLQRMAFEQQQATEQAEFNREMARENARQKAEADTISKNREGGRLDA